MKPLSESEVKAVIEDDMSTAGHWHKRAKYLHKRNKQLRRLLKEERAKSKAWEDMMSSLHNNNRRYEND